MRATVPHGKGGVIWPEQKTWKDLRPFRKTDLESPVRD